jgi:hypothetical protein
MQSVWKCAAFCLVLSGLASQAWAAVSTLQDPVQNTSSPFTYDHLSFTISDCTFNGTSCGSIDNAAIYAISGGNSGTQIGIGALSGYGDAIYSDSGTSRAMNDTLQFTLSVTPQPGSRGISSVKETISGSASTGLGGDLTAELSAFTPGGALTPASVNLNAGSTSATDAFNKVTVGNTLTFTVTLSLNAPALKKGQTLSLNKVDLLFTQAPEPASIGLIATGLVGLGMVRRRFKQKHPLAAA